MSRSKIDDLTIKQKEARELICYQLDGFCSIHPDEIPAAVRARVEKFKNYVGSFKVGNEVFTSIGPEVIRMVHDAGCKVFLDLKFHDTSCTVSKALYQATLHKVWMVNIHATGGANMIQNAVDGIDKALADFHYLDIPRPILLAVTILKSPDDNYMEELGHVCSVKEKVIDLTEFSHNQVIEGVVCSAKDDILGMKVVLCDEVFQFLTPDATPLKSAIGREHKRVVTPGRAIQKGSNLFVMGSALSDALESQGEEGIICIYNDIARYL